MRGALIAAVGGAVLLSGSACEREVTGPVGEVMLHSLEFLPAEIEAGRPFVVGGRTVQGELVERQPLVLRTGAGVLDQGTLVHLGEYLRDPWAQLSDTELAAVIGAWNHVVMIGFKEAGQAQGVDDRGTAVTSSETVARMKEWVQEQGVAITYASVLMPMVGGTMAAEAGLVSVIRAHENIDSLSPGGIPGSWEGGEPTGGINMFAAFPGGAAAAEQLRSGDLVTAEYRQPDGSILRATARVR